MLSGERPTWDVRGHMVLCPGDGGGEQLEYRVRTFPTGNGRVDIDDIAHPIPATMTAIQYFEMIFARTFGPPKQRRAAGD